jgi:alkylation response protein AidB-like acyl-CoA dehydrogenase
MLPFSDERFELQDAVRKHCVATALLPGIAGRCLEVACDYALTREPFNVPIGSFKALNLMGHMVAPTFGARLEPVIT